MSDREAAQAEFDALPEWARTMVLALKDNAGHGGGGHGRAGLLLGMREDRKDLYEPFHVLLHKDHYFAFFEGFGGMRTLAHRLGMPQWDEAKDGPPSPEQP